ncbi:MAG: hypothetical protein L0H93_03985 [Nocardioides sp.]|nr:hypothetical protein [Nocardioides sp.]
MSKMDNLRAMREARYEQAKTRSSGGAKPAAPKPKTPPKVAAAVAADEPGPAAEQPCGHRSMNGRTCTREQGHAAKNHRYS